MASLAQGRPAIDLLSWVLHLRPCAHNLLVMTAPHLPFLDARHKAASQPIKLVHFFIRAVSFLQ